MAQGQREAREKGNEAARLISIVSPEFVKPVIATIEQRLTIKLLGSLADDDIASLRQVLGDIIDFGAFGEG